MKMDLINQIKMNRRMNYESEGICSALFFFFPEPNLYIFGGFDFNLNAITSTSLPICTWIARNLLYKLTARVLLRTWSCNLLPLPPPPFLADVMKLVWRLQSVRCLMLSLWQGKTEEHLGSVATINVTLPNLPPVSDIFQPQLGLVAPPADVFIASEMQNRLPLVIAGRWMTV